MMQGDSYNIPIEISTESGVADKSTFLDVEVYIGDLRKLMSAGDIAYDNDNKVFLVNLTQEESFNFRYGKVPVQVRVKTTTGDVIGTNADDIDVNDAISEAVL